MFLFAHTFELTKAFNINRNITDQKWKDPNKKYALSQHEKLSIKKGLIKHNSDEFEMKILLEKGTRNSQKVQVHIDL